MFSSSVVFWLFSLHFWPFSLESVLVLTSALTPKGPNRALITSPRLLRSLLALSESELFWPLEASLGSESIESLESLESLASLESLESWEFRFADSNAVLIDSSVALIISPILKRSFIGLWVRHDSSVLQRLAFDC